MPDDILMLVLGTIVVLCSAFAIAHAINLVRARGNSELAADMTTSSLPAVTLGVATGGLVVVTDAVLMILGGIISMPDLLITGILGALGYLSIDGILSITPETYGLLVIGGGVVLAIVR